MEGIGPLVVYGVLAAIAVGVALVQGRSPFSCGAGGAWVEMGALGHVVSIAAGAALAAVTVALTRTLVRRFAFAKVLHAHLRPVVQGAGGGTLVVVGVASAASEELFFRGVLATAFGLVVSSLAFGLLHQTRGSARWIWAGWATVMGFLFGALYLATGSLLGPIVAHAAINVANLRFLRDTDVEPPKPRHLGGLLGRVR